MKTLKNFLDNTKNISSIIVGFVFIFSGFIKGIDLLGSNYKFTDYFIAFGFPSLEALSFPLAFILCASEFVIGAALIFRIRMLFFSWLVLLFTSFFTILTLYSAIANPVTDCGCFGEAIILTNWETFWKNIILILLVFNIFLFRHKFRKFFPEPVMEWGLIAGMLIFFTSVSLYSYNNLPVFDFTPYHLGANIRDKMRIPPDAPVDEYKITLIYKKNGLTKEFTLDSLPDSSWTWVETQSVLIKPGFEPPINNFYIETIYEGKDVTEFILTHEGLTFLLIAYDLQKTCIKNLEKIKSLAEYARFYNHRFYVITASPKSIISEFKEKNNVNYEFFNADGIALKTMVRSNPGLLLLKEGTIIGKWHNNNIPEINDIGENALAYVLNNQRLTGENSRKLFYIFLFLFVVSISYNIRKSLK